jgi:hypothetical protein
MKIFYVHRMVAIHENGGQFLEQTTTFGEFSQTV